MPLLSLISWVEKIKGNEMVNLTFMLDCGQNGGRRGKTSIGILRTPVALWEKWSDR
jgi:hypothetical protein